VELLRHLVISSAINKIHPKSHMEQMKRMKYLYGEERVINCMAR